MFAEMFNHCRNLKSIDISNFTIRNDAYAYMMLAECSYLQTVNMGDNTFDNANGLLYLSGRLSDLVYIRCTNTVKDKFVTQSNFYGYNSSIMHCYTDNEEMPEYVPVQNDYYRSTDFSMNGKHKILQHATAGQGVDIVLYGDGYSDRLIADGTYESVANKTMEAIFSMEPYKSYRHLFNVYLYYAVSVNEVIGRDTAFDTSLGTNENTSIIGVINASAFDEELLSITNKPFYKLACVGFVNNDSYHGSCEMVVSNGYEDYGNGRAYAWITANHDEEQYRTTVLHEFGHGFAKLGDEYYLGPNTYTSADDLNWMHKCGFYMNLDTTSSSEDILWSDFLKDTRYANSGLGVFEGGFAKYQYGIWRSTGNSIMNDNNTEYNVPSRKAIYNRIHKLAYGEGWQFDYETFVQQDLKNIPSQTKASPTKSAPYPARVNKTPFFKMEESISSDGKKTITVIMN